MSRQPVTLHDIGTARYQPTWDYQEQLFTAVVETKVHNRDLPPNERLPVQHHFILVEHPPVYTLGKSGHMENLLLDEAGLKREGIEFFKINRGGDITFHGPGQIVGYPILDLDEFFTDIHRYLRYLEEVIIKTIAEYGLKGDRLPGATGVWLDPDDPDKARKICALGVRCSRWVTMHGFAFNVNTDLNYFKHIIPCGIDDKDVTSMARELGHEVDMEEVKRNLLHHFEEQFGATIVKPVEAKS